MSKQISPLHVAYQKVLPLCLRAALGKARNRVKHCVWALQNLNDPHQKKLKKVSTRKAHLHRQKAWMCVLKHKQTINVVFLVTDVSKWKADSLLRLMQKHPRFSPIVWHIPFYLEHNNLPRHKTSRQQCQNYFSAQGAKFVTHASLEAFPKDEVPDLIFVNEPYDGALSRKSTANLTNHLLCFIPYGYISVYTRQSKNTIIINSALRFFLENDKSLHECAKVLDNRGVNATVTGHPMADDFLFPENKRPHVWKECGSHMKRVIWAPHWTLEKDTCWLFYGTFMHTGRILLELAEKYREQIQFAFKPHPSLYDTLCKHPQWGKERTDAFYAKWREMPNTQFEDGAYTDLFMQSDAMIHDCGSFIQEYLFADKPCMYLKYPDNQQEYSSMAADCLNAYQIGITRENIEEFIQMVLRGEDPKAEVRRELRKKYLVPPNGKSAAQNIIDCLLNMNDD